MLAPSETTFELISTLNFSSKAKNVLKYSCGSDTPCVLGTFETFFQVMKNTIGRPHVLDIDWNYKNFPGLTSLNSFK